MLKDTHFRCKPSQTTGQPPGITISKQKFYRSHSPQMG